MKGLLQKAISTTIVFLLSPALLAAELQVLREAFFKGEIMLALETLNMIASAIQFYGTTVTFLLYRGPLLRTISFIDDLNKRMMEELGELARKEIESRIQFGRKAHRIFTATFFLLQSWSIIPILNFILYDIRIYVVHSWLPFETTSLPGYVGNFSFQVSVCWCYCMGYCMFGSLLVAVCEVIFGHIIILRKRLENIKFGTASTLDELVMCIKYQGDIIKICHEIQDLTALPLIVNCIFTVIVLCIILVNFTTSQDDSMVGKINLLTEAQLVLLFLGTYCWYGNEITLRHSQLLRPPYMADWYNGTEAEKKLALNIMTRTMKPIYFGGFIRIDMLTFVNILKGAFSYYNVILAVKE